MVANSVENRQLRVADVFHCPPGDFDGNVRIVRSPDEVNRLVDLFEFRFVTLIDDRYQDLTHGAVCSPVIRGPVCLAGLLHPIVTNQPPPRQSPNQPVRQGRLDPGCPGTAEERYTGQDQRSNPFWSQHGQVEGHSPTKGMTNEGRPFAERVQYRRNQPCVSSSTHRHRRLWRCSKTGQVDGDRIQTGQDLVEVPPVPSPTVQGQHLGRTVAELLAEY